MGAHDLVHRRQIDRILASARPDVRVLILEATQGLAGPALSLSPTAR